MTCWWSPTKTDDFAPLCGPFNAWEPRPVAGTEGLVPAAWDRTVEQHGAQRSLQNRFRGDLQDGTMRPVDYAAWAAMRTIGEAVTRTNSGRSRTDPAHVSS